MKHVVVIGAGLAGLVAANRLLDAGHRVTLVSKAPGGLQLSQGSIDVLGYTPQRVLRPLDAVAELTAPHPYALLGADQVQTAVEWLQGLLGLAGSPDENLQLPTALGAVRPTALAPASLAAGDIRTATSFAVVGVRQLKDFQTDLIAGNLARTVFDDRPLTATATWIDFEARRGEVDSSPVHFARALDDPQVLRRFAHAVARSAGDADVVLVPAVVGLDDPDAWVSFTEVLDRRVAEVPTPPPSVPGLRMFNTLLDRARDKGVRYVQGAFVDGFEADGDRVTSLRFASAGAPTRVRCDAVVHAPGGFESGALSVDSHGNIDERVFGLPLTERSAVGLLDDHLDAPQPLFEVGVRVDDGMRPINSDGHSVCTNLHVVGGILAGAQRWREKSGDGIAVASAVRAADTIGAN